MVQKLKFGVYDIDNKTIDLSDDDFLGECECTLGQVSIHSHCTLFCLSFNEFGVLGKNHLIFKVEKHVITLKTVYILICLA